MSQSKSWFQQTPAWVWLSLIPTLGGFAIVYAGYKSKTNTWIGIGISISTLALAFSANSLAFPIWMAQIGVAFYLKKSYLIKIYPKNLPVPEEQELAKLVASTRDKIDINECSKHELVNYLGLPIVYANNIESLMNEGYVFTHVEELIEIAGIPEKQVARITPLITFSYNYKKEADFSWKRLNTYSTPELIACGLDGAIAEQIVTERQQRGEYKSLIEVKQRTGLPFTTYRHIA
ncbi:MULTISPECIES: helix-hairpin-helix domain-containing protein [unclassified Nostoc]|uniref:helix-hairpin-helix domain-containing protein n=1 Tax=unclassified Nostoc TaxID=2593658 RepID=UPI002AD2F03F|nr:helix-hairpin-helix domain-containing protein [Nostoc sp. DedQUE03]MDZ7976928.1 helix-hairpin-helix domain-containing protein [Nostoc sp. DedQUE03]MDZ8043325.1 helix-hairpin-helix domain-containing protein [Nostoc sp. DedQUE02]